MYLSQITLLSVLLGSIVSSCDSFSPSFTSLHKNIRGWSTSQLQSSGPECFIELDDNTNKFVTRGQPSAAGWKNPSQLDRLTEWVTCDEANRPIICEYDPDATWLWTKWSGTVLSITYIPVILNMSLGIAVDRYVHLVSDLSWSFISVPPSNEPLIQELVGMKGLWEYQLTLCTFILAFFTSQAYSFWRSVYFTTRAIQGRINDVCLLVTISASRGGKQNDNEPFTSYSEEATSLVQTCTRLLRLSHTFFWASTPTSSNGLNGDNNDERNEQIDSIEIGPILLSPKGLESLKAADELTSNEVDALLSCGLPPSQYTYVLLEWVSLYIMEGFRDGIFCGGNGMEENMLRQITSLRAEYFSIGDYVSGRMPLAYVQLVQIIVDSLVWLSPFSLYSSLGGLSIPLVGLLTLFFKGLLELSKSFLDPFGNEGYPAQNLHVDVLVSELNFGASSRWVKAAEFLPIRDENKSKE